MSTVSPEYKALVTMAKSADVNEEQDFMEQILAVMAITNHSMDDREYLHEIEQGHMHACELLEFCEGFFQLGAQSVRQRDVRDGMASHVAGGRHIPLFVALGCAIDFYISSELQFKLKIF